MTNDKDKKRLSRFWRFLHRFVGPCVKRRFNYSWEPVDIAPPFLMISSHVTNSDPFFIGLTYKKAPLAFVASEHIFRQGLLSKLLMRYLAPIPRPKADSGVGTVRAVLKRLREGDPVVLFAEGDCTWNGVSGKIFPATGKLAKASGVPLATYRLERGYLSSPRWANRSRRGEVFGRLVHVYSPEELKAMTPEEADAAIDRDICFDVWSAQRERPVPFRSKAPAEGLEKALFVCPECGNADCMSSKGNRLFCAKCGAEWNMDECGFLNGPGFGTVSEWDEWQKGAILSVKGSGLFPFEAVLTDLDTDARRKAEVSLDLGGESVVIGGKAVRFGEISDMAMVKTNRLLFTDGAGYHELKTKRGILRPYLEAWKAYRERKE